MESKHSGYCPGEKNPREKFLSIVNHWSDFDFSLKSYPDNSLVRKHLLAVRHYTDVLFYCKQLKSDGCEFTEIYREATTELKRLIKIKYLLYIAVKKNDFLIF